MVTVQGDPWNTKRIMTTSTVKYSSTLQVTIDKDTGEMIKAIVAVCALPYSISQLCDCIAKCKDGIFPSGTIKSCDTLMM